MMSGNVSFETFEENKHFLYFIRGDEKGLQYFMKRWHEQISKHAKKILSDDFEIGSIIQDAFMNVWRYRANINNISHLFYTIRQQTKWLCYETIRKLKKQKTVALELYEYQLMEIYDNITVIEQQQHTQIREELLEEAIAFLPQDMQTVINLWKKGASPNYIAQLLHTSHQHIVSKINKSIAHLKIIQNRLEKMALASFKRPKLLLSDYKVYLNNRQAQIFKFYYEEGYSLKEIADQLQLSMFQVQKQYTSIRHVISKNLKLFKIKNHLIYMENIVLENLFRKINMPNSFTYIKTLFRGERKVKYDPPYQRSYVWNEVKATNFIETILWHGDAPPVVLYQKSDNSLEVIDGRQRCETIDLFLSDKFALKPQGLDKLWYLSGKIFSQLEDDLQNRILFAKLRCIIIEPNDEKGLTQQEEDALKREIFKRYNMGMSALKKEEVYKAQYLHDEITVYLKIQLEKDTQLQSQLTDVFQYKKKNTETMMQHLRQLLVVAEIPLNWYIADREDIINKYYDYYTYNIINKKEGYLEELLSNLKKNVNFLAKIKEMLNIEYPHLTNTLVVYDCIYWGLAIAEKEGVAFEQINSQAFKTRLVNHIAKNVQTYAYYRSNFAQIIRQRYFSMATFFSSQFILSFSNYLKADREYTTDFRKQINQYIENRLGHKVKSEPLTQAIPTSLTICDIIDIMSRKHFNIRPPYQRKEVMTIAKASSLIESILLGLKLPPLYVFVRVNGVIEVIDGQQRLLALIGFLGQQYLGEQGCLMTTQKNNFTLNLTKPLLQEINKKKFNQLPLIMQNKIRNYNLDIIEIKETDNISFKPEELYKRLNHKPMPIKEHTFEFWNAYVDSDLIYSIKDIFQRNPWLYVRKEDNRMQNLEMITFLCYINLFLGTGPLDMQRIREVLDFYEYDTHMVIRIKYKAKVSETLESPDYKKGFLLSLNHFEEDFLKKVICLTDNPKGRTTESFRNKRLDTILQTGTIRNPMRFLVLWLILSGVSVEQLKDARSTVMNRINKIFSSLKVAGSMAHFEYQLQEIWRQHGVVIESEI